MVGRRYGGRYSPDGPSRGERPPGGGGGGPALGSAFRNRRPRRVSIRARLLYLVPIPLLFAGLGAIGRGDALEMLVELGGFAGLMLAAWLTNEGLKAEAAFEARTVAKPPAVPRKILAAALIAASVFGVGLLSLGHGLLGALAFAAVAAGAHMVSFGPDPLRAKGIEGDAFATERVARAIDEAEGVVRETMAAARGIGDRRLEGRVERLCDQAREVFRTIERDSRDLARARRFLSVYLVGLRDATVKFAELYRRSGDREARASYEALIGDLETSFAAHRRDLLEDNRSALDIEIEVLRERLQQDGLTVR